MNVIAQINERIKKETFFEFSLLSFEKGQLVVAGSSDFIYYHKIEIHFTNIFAILCNANWRVDTSIDCIELVTGQLLYELNIKYNVEEGHRIFRFLSEDNVDFYVIAKNIDFRDVLVKY